MDWSFKYILLQETQKTSNSGGSGSRFSLKDYTLADSL